MKRSFLSTLNQKSFKVNSSPEEKKKDDELMRTEQDLLLFERQDHRRRTFKYWKSKLEKHQKDFKIFINNKRKHDEYVLSQIKKEENRDFSCSQDLLNLDCVGELPNIEKIIPNKL